MQYQRTQPAIFDFEDERQGQAKEYGGLVPGK